MSISAATLASWVVDARRHGNIKPPSQELGHIAWSQERELLQELAGTRW